MLPAVDMQTIVQQVKGHIRTPMPEAERTDPIRHSKINSAARATKVNIAVSSLPSSAANPLSPVVATHSHPDHTAEEDIVVVVAGDTVAAAVAVSAAAVDIAAAAVVTAVVAVDMVAEDKTRSI
jgi:hypothetical protein